MALEQIITIIIGVLIAVFVWGIFKKLAKLMFIAGMIIFLVLGVNLLFIYQDFTDLRENFGTSEKKVILKDENKLLTGLILSGKTEMMTDEQISEYSTYLQNKEYEKILDDSYKLLVFDYDIISNIDDPIIIDDKTLSKNQIDDILKFGNNAEEKAELFSILLADEILNSKNPLFFFSEFKDENIIIYPETALFKTIKIIPLSFIKDVAGKMIDKTKDTVKTLVKE